MKLEVKYGLLTALFLCLWVMVEFMLGFHNSNFGAGRISWYFSAIIPIITIFKALKEKRDSHKDKNIKFKEGIFSGALISIITAVTLSLFFLLYNNVINPSWRESALVWEKQQLIEKGLTEEQANAKVEPMKKIYNDGFQALWGMIFTFSLGMFISAVVTILIQKPQNPPKA